MTEPPPPEERDARIAELERENAELRGRVKGLEANREAREALGRAFDIMVHADVIEACRKRGIIP